MVIEALGTPHTSGAEASVIDHEPALEDSGEDLILTSPTMCTLASKLPAQGNTRTQVTPKTSDKGGYRNATTRVALC